MTIFTTGMNLVADELPKLGQKLTDEQVTAFADLALEGMDQEYPNKPSNVLADANSIRSPKEMHPAFYGCFDWHSSVHGHWMLLRLIKTQSWVAPPKKEIRAKLDGHLTGRKHHEGE